VRDPFHGFGLNTGKLLGNNSDKNFGLEGHPVIPISIYSAPCHQGPRELVLRLNHRVFFLNSHAFVTRDIVELR
jgi:hypothetical protein